MINKYNHRKQFKILTKTFYFWRRLTQISNETTKNNLINHIKKNFPFSNDKFLDHIEERSGKIIIIKIHQLSKILLKKNLKRKIFLNFKNYMILKKRKLRFTRYYKDTHLKKLFQTLRIYTHKRKSIKLMQKNFFNYYLHLKIEK